MVLSGTQLPEAIGLTPELMVGFAWSGGWVQVPVQVDGRFVEDFGTIYNTTPTGYTFLTYADTSTFSGADPDPAFDIDDEFVFMLASAGDEADTDTAPLGVVPETGLEITIYDDLDADTLFLYVFETDGTLDPSAGEPDIDYNFVLLSGDYKTTYGLMSGPNPENSTVVTPYYSVHFSDRWIRDETAVHAGASTGADIMDRHKNLFAPGNCGRSEDTFSAGEGAFIINKRGPVRAVRGYVGANSGPTTHRIHFFYEDIEKILTVLRVHAISGMMDYFDYSPGASGMTYYNAFNMGGVTIDGSPDAVTPGEIVWEMVTGTQGTVSIVLSIITDVPSFAYTSYYSDDVTPSVTQCTGDDYEYGASGVWINMAIPNTDPGAAGDLHFFRSWRSLLYKPPGETTDLALAHEDAVYEEPAYATVPFSHLTGTGGLPHEELLSAFTYFSVSPNPSSGGLNVRFALTKAGTVEVALYDVSGRRIKSLGSGWFTAGPSLMKARAGDLNPGVYFMRAKGPGGSLAASRVVILR